MKVKYEEGPEVISMGAAGQFKKGEAKELDDMLAESLLRKETIRFVKVEDNPPISPFIKGGEDGKKRRDK